MQDRIHPTALIDGSARIGEGTTIGPYAVVEGDVTVGTDCWIAAHAVIKSYCRIGDRNQIFEGAVIGAPPQDLAWERTRSFVEIGNGNVLREGVTVHRATEQDGGTRIGNDCFLMACSHVAHNCVLGDGVVIANNVALAGHVTVENRAFLSGGVVVHQFSKIGESSMVGGNAKVEKSVVPYTLVDGVPARTRGLNLVGLRRHGLTREEIRVLKKAYKILFRSPGGLSEKLETLRSLSSVHTDNMVDFLTRSKRGYCRERD